MMVSIVKIENDNANLLRNVAEDVFDYPVNWDLLKSYLTESNHLMFVALLENRVVGQILGVIHKHPDKVTELYIDDLGVTPDLQRQGIATKLTTAIFAEARQLGCREVWVATEPDNDLALAFYRSLGLSARTTTVFEGEL